MTGIQDQANESQIDSTMDLLAASSIGPVFVDIQTDFLPGEELTVALPVAAQEVSESLLRTDDSLKVGIAQIKTNPGDIEGNTKKIIAYIERAKTEGAEVVVFPELAVTGYCSMDLFYNADYITANVLALEKIKRATSGITAIVGFVSPEVGQVGPGGKPILYNSAAVLRDGETVSVHNKSLLPEYNIFFEQRYFTPAEVRTTTTIKDHSYGVEICEDLWSENYKVDPTKELAELHAEAIFNISASPFNRGKFEQRLELIQQQARETGKPIIYTNLVGGYDGYDGEVIFDGRSLVVSPEGAVLGMGKGFEEDFFIVDVFRAKEMAIPEVPAVEELRSALVLGLRDYAERLGRAQGKPLNQFIIGMSGGIDSAVVAGLAVEALGPDRVLGITLPSKYSSDETKGDAYLEAERLGIRIKTTSIAGQVAACEAALRVDPDVADLPDDVAEENIQARLRMIDLMYYSNKLGGVVLNTGNRTESALNNCTIYGDMVGGVSVLGDVDKDFVYDLAEQINIDFKSEVIPRSVIDRVPSAELKPGQTDATVMGDHPREIAPMVRDIIENQLSVSRTIEKWGFKYLPDLIAKKFDQLDYSEWKRRQLGPAIRVAPLGFNEGRRIPMNHGFRS